MTALPDIPTNAAGADDPYMEFLMVECRTCGERGPWEAVDGDEQEAEAVSWNVTHADGQRSHDRYYVFRVTRQTARLYRF